MQEYEKKAALKREALADKIPIEWRIPASKLPGPEVLDVSEFPRTSGLLTKEELEITETNLVPLAHKIASGAWTAKEVTTAFCHRAALAHQLVNCCVEIFFDQAIASAEKLDESFKASGKVVGPLHGVPVSLKDQFRVTGVETSMGYVAWLGKTEKKDSIFTDLLRKAGAVLYVKTNVPQTLMVGETVNNIFGRTLNPFNRELSCGGSSGGEGALLGLRGSVIGLGTDIGGSIRMPAAFNHLFGIRPSHGRLPYALMANSMEGQETVHSVVGPLGHSAEDISFFMKAVLAQEPWFYDPKVVELPWNFLKFEAGAHGTKTFGYFDFDGVVMPHPPIKRAIKEVVAALKAQGHKVVPWKPFDHARGIDIINKVYTADGNEDVTRTLKAGGEPAIPNIVGLLGTDTKAATLNEAWDLQLEKYHYQREHMEYWNQQNLEHGTIDGIIMPVAPHAAVTHNDYFYYGYTAIINILDYPSMVVPVGFASPSKDPVDSHYKPSPGMDHKVYLNYEPAKYENGPTAVQIVGRRFQEEYVIGLAQQVETALQS
ncbi:putative General amidase GmdA [Taphrina deformans PYCC 5710]|uniref:amidase n=1 Tax=Taphrina deformans (strain PYCC 5710 / ATCC 11124 / CBS 356.35 / IMI 108563 / JCM 9778 / NBRC 8474) TaxID=1097556 RepID=R4XEN3_TAPDE|nr:putative General amidase GmdA [Taphrina deformans PYCC 5710]|eukprot:CCG81827.1 putative General amidase GmdA [Taphrina deformans PYCC 5710]